MKKIKLSICTLFVFGFTYGQDLNELYDEYTNLQASLIQLNFANTNLKKVKTHGDLLSAYGKYLRNAIKQGDVPEGTPKIGGNDPVEGIDIIVKKDPSSRPMDNPGNIPIIDEVNKLEADYLKSRVTRLDAIFNEYVWSKKEGTKKTEQVAYIKKEIESSKAAKASLVQKSSATKSQQSGADGFGPVYRGEMNAGIDGFGPVYRGVTNTAVDGFGPVYRGSIYIGSSSPVGKFNDFAKTGFDFGLTFDFLLAKSWGLGFDFNNQQNGVDFPLELYRIPESGVGYTITSTESRKGWSTTTFSFGPWWLIEPGGSASKFSFELYSKAGISRVSGPSAKTTLAYINNQNADLFAMDAQKKTAFGLTSGLRFNYKVGENVALFINPQYVYTSAKIEYTYKNLENAYQGSVFNPGMAIEAPTEEDFVRPNYFNVNVGVTYSFGSKRKPEIKTSDIQPERDVHKRRIVLASPPNNVVFSENIYKEFTWKVIGSNYTSPKYKIEVISVKDPSERYVAYSNQPSITTMEVFKEAKLNGSYTWKVTEQGSSDQSDFAMLKSTRTGLLMQLQNLSCSDTSFDANGNVNYSAEVVFENLASNTVDIIVEGPSINMIGLIPGNQNTTATIVQCGTDPLVTLPLTITPGSSVTACIEFQRPLGETQVITEAFYHNADVPGYQMNEGSLYDLPNCMCNVCEEWVLSEENIDISPSNSAASNYMLSTNLHLANAQNIIKVTASIVDFRLNSATGCDSCLSSTSTSGIFSGEPGSGVFSNGSANWQNNGAGNLYDDNNDNYGDELEWNATSAAGVDFSTAQNVSINLNLPDIASNACCGKTYQVCIKYTFTNENCETCDFTKCYTVTNR